MRWLFLIAAVSSVLALSATRALAEDGASRWRPATKSALEFGVFAGRLWDFDGATLSLRRHTGEHSVWRFGLDWNLARQRADLDARSNYFGARDTAASHFAVDRYSLGAQLTRLTIPYPERRLRPWFGAALGGTLRHEGMSYALRAPSTLVQESDLSRTSWRVYLAALAGLEYAISPRFLVHAQYGQGAQHESVESSYHGNLEQVAGDSGNWQWYSTGARAGVAVFW